MKKNKKTPTKFNFFSLKFEPYSHLRSQYSSKNILTEVFNYLRDLKKKGKGHLIDRNENRKIDLPRELFMVGTKILPTQRKILCTMALLRKGRQPKLKPLDKYKLLPIDTLGEIAEETHFFIDFSGDKIIICAEYNHHGARVSDLEYYLRNVSRDKLSISKQTEVVIHFENTIEKTIHSLQNVLHMDIKLKPKKIAQMDNDIKGSYFLGMNKIGLQLKPHFLRVESYFQTPGKNDPKINTNKEANNMMFDLLSVFKKRPKNKDCFEDFVVKYVNKDGEDAVFNLLKGKKELVIDIDTSNTTLKEMYELIKLDFNDFVLNQ
jgi:hypothetical protein